MTRAQRAVERAKLAKAQVVEARLRATAPCAWRDELRPQLRRPR